MVPADHTPREHQPEDSPPETIEELARRQGVKPVESVEDLAAPEVFESDEKLDEFLAWLYAERHRDDDLSHQMPGDWDDPEVWPMDEWP